MKRALCLSLLLVGTGCVTKKAHLAKVSELEKIQADHDRAAAEKVKRLEAELKDVQARLAKTIAERDELQKKLNDTSAFADVLKARLEKLGQNVDKLTSEKGQLAKGLEDAKVRLEELRKQKAAAEKRAQVFHDLVRKLRSMIDSGKLKVIIRNSRMLIALPNDVLFDSGKTDIKKEGKAAIAEVGKALATIEDRHFVVAGHTDDVPIHTARFPSNWELSTARAVEVTRFLVASGMKPQVLAAAGYGEFDPLVANDTAEHKAQNRRIEIVLEPNLSDLPSLEDVMPKE